MRGGGVGGFVHRKEEFASHGWTKSGKSSGK